MPIVPYLTHYHEAVQFRAEEELAAETGAVFLGSALTAPSKTMLLTCISGSNG